MAERIRDCRVKECKGFTPPNVPTTSASSTRLPLGSLDLNTRVPSTGTATPPRRRLTESQRSADFDLATKRARYAQRTVGQLLHDAHKKRTRRARQQQQRNAAATAEAVLQAQQEETIRRPGNYNGESRDAKYYSAVVLCTEVLKSRRIYIF